MKSNTSLRREKAVYYDVMKKIKRTALDQQERGDEYK